MQQGTLRLAWTRFTTSMAEHRPAVREVVHRGFIGSVTAFQGDHVTWRPGSASSTILMGWRVASLASVSMGSSRPTEWYNWQMTAATHEMRVEMGTSGQAVGVSSRSLLSGRRISFQASVGPGMLAV